MSKAVMISIKPQRCELVTQGKETVEVRKTKPKLKTPFKCYIYETKGLYRGSTGCLFQGLGKVIGEFVCDYIEEYLSVKSKITGCVEYQISLQKLCEDIDLSIHEFCSYGNGKPLYGWHISDLVIYDKPKELYEFDKPCTDPYQYCEVCKHGLVQYPSDIETYEDLAGCCYDTVCLNQLQKPPQSWCYVEVKE
nr:MAG TPA: hypothetical protein [Caudoviricetes sp.]